MVPKKSYTFKFEATRVLGHLLAPADFEWATVPPRGEQAPLVIHLSCNAHFTVFIPYLIQQILRKVGLETLVLGGPENCCGNPQIMFGDLDLEPKVAMAALRGFERLKPQTVLSICPDCDDNFNKHKTESMGFRYVNASQIFVDHLDELSKLMQPVHRRVVVHTHDANDKRMGDRDLIMTILKAIPGLQILTSEHSGGPGNHCQTQRPMASGAQAGMFKEARELGADAIVVPYHSCYRQHISKQLDHGVEVVHYAGLLAASLGIEFDETLKRLRLLNEVEAVVDDLRPKIAAFGYDEDEVRSYVESTIFI
jgi:hypothetical protein